MSTLELMYPVDVILVISRDEYEVCSSDTENVSSEEFEIGRAFRNEVNNENNNDNGFLIVESVTGTERDAFVSGSSASYYALFDEKAIPV